MSEKELLQKRLKEIEEREQIDRAQKELQDFRNSGFYIPCGKARIKRNIWHITEYTFQEMDDGWYTRDELLGYPGFKKGQILMKIKSPDGNYFYCEEQSSMDDYAYIADNEQVLWDTDASSNIMEEID